MSCALRRPWFASACLLFFTVIAAGCGSSSQDRLVGHWEGKVSIDEAAVQEEIDKKTKNPVGAAIAKRMMDALLKRVEAATMSMEFDADGTFRASAEGIPGMAKKREGNWRVVRQDGNEVVIELEMKDKAEEATLRFEGPDAFVLAFPEEAEGTALPKFVKMRFTRVE